ncbi:MAG: tetratricopeptide repeat protein [Cyclobacteriaceae bacterium]
MSWSITSRRVQFFIIFMLGHLFLQAQSKIDSLKAKLSGEVNQQQITLLNNIGYEYWIVNPSLSIYYGQRAKQMAISLNDSSQLGFAFRVIGVAYWAKGSYDQALINIQNGLIIYTATGDSLGQANCLMNQGLVFHDRQDFDRALEQFFKALEIFERLRQDGRVATTYSKIGSALIETNELERAKEYLLKALEIHRENGFQYGEAEALNRLGLLELENQDLEKSLSYLDQSKKISEEINDKDGLAKYYEDVAQVYVQKNDFDTAELMLQLGANLSLELGLNSRLRTIFLELKKIYAIRGDLKKSLAYADKYITLRDSLFSEETSKNLIEFEKQLAISEQVRLLELKESEIEVLEKNARISWLIRLIILVVVAFGAFIFYLIYQQQKLKLLRKQEKAEEEAKALNYQLEQTNRELAAYTVNYVQKNKVFEELKNIVVQVKTNQKTDPTLKEKFKQLERAINSQLNSERDWDDFKVRFQTLHSNFFDKLMAQNESLTNNELRLSALIKLNLSMKEVANILGISSESVKTARYRLKKKLNLPSELSLNDFFNTID